MTRLAARLPAGAVLVVAAGILLAPDAARAQAARSDEGLAPSPAVSRLVREALQMRTVEASAQSPPALSPDGALLAYAVRTPVTDRRTRRAIPPRATEREAFLLRRPLELLVLEVGSGEVTRVSPAGASGWQPVWSPDGSTLLFYSDADGGIRLWAYDRRLRRSRRVSERRVAEGFRATTPPRWSRGGRAAYVALDPPAAPETPRDVTVVVHASGREADGRSDPRRLRVDPGFDRSLPADLALVDLDSGASRVVLPSTADPTPQRPDLSPSGKWLLYGGPPRNNVWLAGGANPPGSLADLSADLGLVPVEGGAPVLLEEDADLEGTAWHPEQDLVVYVKGGQLWAASCGTGPAPVRRRLGAELGRLGGSFLAFSTDGRSVLLAGRGRDGETALASVPLDGSPGRLISLGPHLSFAEVVTDADRTLWPRDGRSATTLVRDARTGEDTLWRVDLAAGTGSELWRAPGRVRLTGASRDPAGIFAVVEDPRNPPDLFWFSSSFADRRRLTRLNAPLEGAPVGPIEYFTAEVPGFDGTLSTVRTAVLRPLGTSRDGTARAIVCVYPGNDHSLSAAQFGGGEKCGLPSYVLAAAGFVVVLPHLPKRARGTRGNVSQEYADALLPVVYRGGGLGHYDSARLALFGHSQGGYAATAVLSETNLFRAAVSASSVAYDLVASWGYIRPGFLVPNLWPITGLLMSGTPWDDLKRYVENSPYLQADRITTPLLLVVGTADRFPHVEEAGKFFNALRTHERTVQLAIYEGEDHYIFRGSLANSIDLWNRVLRFVDGYVPRPAARPAPVSAPSP
jgi:dipeptidyl aminopeptidase/acylaminoacyl peptidase